MSQEDHDFDPSITAYTVHAHANGWAVARITTHPLLKVPQTTLVCVCVYKKGAEFVKEELETLLDKATALQAEEVAAEEFNHYAELNKGYAIDRR